MKTTTNTCPRWRLGLAMLLLLAGCATPAAYREGQEMIDQGRYEEGLNKLADAIAEAPEQPKLRSTLALQKDRIVATLQAKAGNARVAGNHAEAEQNYRRILRIAPHDARAQEGIRVLEQRRNLDEMQTQAQAAFTRGDLELAEKRLLGIFELDPRHEPALALRQEIETQRARVASPYPQLRTSFARPVSLEFRDANLKMILDVLSRTTGINFIVDKDVRPDLKATIFVRQVPVEDALELLLTQSQLDKKVINDNTVVIYADTPTKNKEYQEWAIRTFYITNMDVKQAQNLVKTILKTRDTVIDEKLNILTMRDTPEAIRLAEKLFLAQDQPEPEVVLEVELLDVSRDRFLDLGIQWPSAFSVLAPGGGAARLLSDLRFNGERNRVGIDRTIEGRARETDNDINTLASPRIRVRNKEKAKIHIGDRIPVVTSSFVPGSTAGVTTQSVSYLETGIKLEVEPQIHLNEEVTIKINLDVSDSTDVTPAGATTTQIRVKTSNATTVLRLKDGETQILAGLLRNDQNSNADQIPGLGGVPALGRLFGKHDDSWKKRELVLSITPHIVRSVPYVGAHNLEFSSGTEGSLRARPLSMQSNGGEAVSLSAPPAAPAAANGRIYAPAAVAAPVPAANGGELTVTLEGDEEIRVGEESIVKLLIKTNQPLVSTALQIGFDPKAIKVLEVTEGDLMRGDGTPTTFSTRMDESAGRIFVGLARAGSVGATGEGELLQLRVQGVEPTPGAAVKVVVFSGMGPGRALHSPALPAPLGVAVVP